jgi:hypothetical protein
MARKSGLPQAFLERLGLASRLEICSPMNALNDTAPIPLPGFLHNVHVAERTFSDTWRGPLLRNRHNLDMHIYSNHRGVQMQKSKPDWRSEKMVGIFRRYHSAIRARSGEGRQYAMRCFYAVLVYEGLLVEKLGPRAGQPFEPASGAGYLLVENAFVADVACAPHITPYTVLRTFPHMPAADLDIVYRRMLFNFGSMVPEWYPCPMDASELKAFLNRRWLFPLCNRRVSLALVQSASLKWEAPYVQ